MTAISVGASPRSLPDANGRFIQANRIDCAPDGQEAGRGNY
jgi:hypothetical protein